MPPKTYQITGRVIDSKTKQAIEGLMLWRGIKTLSVMIFLEELTQMSIDSHLSFSEAGEWKDLSG